jgi:predicted transcriptional regulator
MKLPEIDSIEKLRKKKRMTQTELAKLSGVSQSLIARIEARTVDPSYSKVVKIFNALTSTENQEISAKEIMTRNVVGVETRDTLGKAIDMMKKYKVSQMPVFEDNKLAGSMNEAVIMSQIAKGANIRTLSQKKVGEYMDDPFPALNPSTSIKTISSLLEHNKAVLITDKGRIEGIITKADLLKVVGSE